MWEAGVSWVAVTVLYVEGLMLDPMCDMPHVQVTTVALQLSSKVAESVLFHTHAFSLKLRTLDTQAFVSQLLDAVRPTA